MTTRRFVIIVAGGKGLRMGQEFPKQFIPIAGKPILMHTLNKFHNCTERILVLPKAHIDYWKKLCQEYNYRTPHTILSGGATRFDSVQSGLIYLSQQAITANDLVAIHDGVRPLVSETCIENSFALAQEKDSALPYLPMTDSLRRIDKSGGNRSLNREEYIRIQTPQVFRLSKLLRAYRQKYQNHFTDDASVWESAGEQSPPLILSNEENIKITSPIDLHLADILLRQEAPLIDV